MKTNSNTTTISKLGFLVCLMMLSFTGFAQVAGAHFTVALANVTSTTNTLEMDVTITVDGTNAQVEGVQGMQINAVQVGINYNPAILNGGTPCSTINCGSWAYIGGKSPQLQGLGATGNTTSVITTSYGHLKISANASNTPNNVPNGTYTLGRYRLTNTVAWASSSNAQLSIQATTASGKIGAQISAAPHNSPGGQNFTYTFANAGLSLSPGTAAPMTYLLNSCSNTSSSETITACDTYTWTAGNGNVYTESGTYTSVTTIPGGTCTDTKTLNLTITPSTSHTTNVSVCDTYTWTAGNGQTYTESGNYPYVTGCHTETLHLTITPSTSHTTTASACDTYHWGVNDADYTASGTYEDVRDCHTEILVLTITPSSSNTTTASACGNYTWDVNDQNYTASGTYSVVTGCHTEILNLTINNSAITTQPASTFICSTVGSTASYTVASNVSAATYTWQYRVVTKTITDPAWITIDSNNAGTVYSNYNSATLGVTKTSKLPAVGTQYRVLVAGGCGVLTSDTATLLIITTTKAGTISTPATTVCVGGSMTFTVAGYAATSFQWQSSPISTTAAPGTFTDIPGATGTSYTLTDAQLTSNRSYRVVVGNSCNGLPATSATKTITVNAPSVAGTITGGGTVCSASGAGTLKVTGYLGKVQWEFSTDGGNTYSNAPKAADGQTSPFSTTSTSSTSSSYKVTGITADVSFRVKATNGACSSSYTAPVQFTVGSTAVVGSVSPASSLLCPATGTTLTLSGTAVGTTTWQKSTNWASATPTWAATTNHSTSYATGNLTASTAYRVASTIGTCSTVYSNLAIVNIVAKPVAKPIAKNITSPTGATAATAMCTSDASKVLTLGAGYVGDVQWQSSLTTGTAGFTDIAGATSASYTITNAAVGPNYFRARLSNSCGVEVFSAIAIVYYKECVVTKDVVKTPFSVVAYPNPYTENFNLSLTTSSVEAVGVAIYDMTGKLIDRREVRANEVSDLQVGDRYPSGVYNVVVTQGSEVKTLRVIKR